MEEFIERLREIRSDIDYESCTELVKEGGLTSFDIIQIVAMIREEYDVKIPVADVVPANFRSAAAIWSMVEDLLDE